MVQNPKPVAINLMEEHLKELAQVPIEAIKHQPFIANLRFNVRDACFQKEK